MADSGKALSSATYNELNLPESAEVLGTPVCYLYLADGTKLAAMRNGTGYIYCGSMVYRGIFTGASSLAAFESTGFSAGRIVKNGSAIVPTYHVNDYLCSVRVVTDATGEVLERNDYSGFGKRLESSTGSLNRYRFSGKEEQSQTVPGWQDFGARMYDPDLARWTTPDPLADQYPGISPYAYCAGDPVNFVDPEGKEWYSYKREYRDGNKPSNFVTEYAWTVASSQEELNNLGIKGTYLGEIVVVFDGYYDEHTGENISIIGKGAKAAKVTVYGRNGVEDKQNYIGYTMTSNYDAFGAIDNGVYDVTYKVPGKGGVLASNYAVNDAGPVNCLDGINPSPLNFYPYSSKQKNGIYIHRTNIGGRIPYDLTKGKAVSSGCLLINDADWLNFVNQIGENGFKLILNRK